MSVIGVIRKYEELLGLATTSDHIFLEEREQGSASRSAVHQEHDSPQKQFACMHCDKSYSTSRGLKCHVTRTHPLASKSSVRESEPERTASNLPSLDDAEMKVPTLPSLDDAEMKVPTLPSLDDAEMKETPTVSECPPDRVRCKYCEKTFKPKGLKTHISRMHYVECEYCDRTFRTVKSLHRHMKKHHADMDLPESAPVDGSLPMSSTEQEQEPDELKVDDGQLNGSTTPPLSPTFQVEHIQPDMYRPITPPLSPTFQDQVDQADQADQVEHIQPDLYHPTTPPLSPTFQDQVDQVDQAGQVGHIQPDLYHPITPPLSPTFQDPFDQSDDLLHHGYQLNQLLST